MAGGGQGSGGKKRDVFCGVPSANSTEIYPSTFVMGFLDLDF